MRSSWRRNSRQAKAEVFDKNYLCKMCQAPAVKAVVFDNGAAFFPTCQVHLDETVGFVTATMRYGTPDAVVDVGGPDVQKAEGQGALVMVSKYEAEEIRKLHNISEGLTPIEQRDGDDDDDT